MPPENATVTRSGKKSEWMVWMIVYRRVELANDVVEHTRRNGEDSTAIAAIRWMTDAISRFAREEYRLVYVGGGSAPSEVAREGAVTHQDDIVGIRFFLRARPTAFDVTAVVVHADDRALVERAEDNIFIAIVGHRCYRTMLL